MRGPALASCFMCPKALCAYRVQMLAMKVLHLHSLTRNLNMFDSYNN